MGDPLEAWVNIQDSFRAAEDEHSSWSKSRTKLIDDLPLRVRIEVDQDVPAENNVECAEGAAITS